MSEDLIVNRAVSQNTLVYGRTLNSARQHHFVIDGTRDPKEELTPVEVFLSAVSACCVQWIEQFAREEDIAMRRIEVEITGARNSSETNRFQFVEMNVHALGPSQSKLEDFTARFTERCPLFRTVKAATEIRMNVFADQVE